MEIRNLGRSGLRVSLVGLGCSAMGGRLDAKVCQSLIHAALDLGVTVLDTADVYGQGASETMLGAVLGHRRKDFVIATKFGQVAGCSRRAIMLAVEASLRRLRTDWIDLYQVHWPDTETPIEETLAALGELIAQGKVRYAGCSNFPAWRVADAAGASRHLGRAGLVSCQNPYSLLERGVEAELVPAMQAGGLGLIPYFPLARGLLTGRYRRGQVPPPGSGLAEVKRFADRFLVERNFDRLDALGEFCARRGRSITELALSWLARRPPVASIIAGASSADQLATNARSVGWELGADELAEIDRIAPPH